MNVSYSQNEYEKQEKKVIDHMKSTGEWGKFFPPSCSPYELNNSMTYEYFSVDKNLALSLGF